MKPEFFSLVFACFLLSCSKEGTGGKAEISGKVKHHEQEIQGANVYIMYSTKEFPGTNTAEYDAAVVADTNSFYKFTGLKKGDYYLYATGFDSTGSYPVSGGVPAKIKNKSENKSLDIPVTE